MQCADVRWSRPVQGIRKIVPHLRSFTNEARSPLPVTLHEERADRETHTAQKRPVRRQVASLSLGKEVFLIFAAPVAAAAPAAVASTSDVIDLSGDSDSEEESTAVAAAAAAAAEPGGEICVRLHFGMSGTLVLDRRGGPRSARCVVQLALTFGDDSLLEVVSSCGLGTTRLALARRLLTNEFFLSPQSLAQLLS